MAYINSDFVLGDKWHLKVNPYYQTLRGYSLSYQDQPKAPSPAAIPSPSLSYNARPAPRSGRR